MSWSIYLYNNLTYSLAVIILLSTVIFCPRWLYIIALFLITGVGQILHEAPNLIMPINALLLTLLFAKNRREYQQTFYRCLTVIFLVWFSIVTISSFIMIITPNWHNTNGYNLFMGGTLLLLSLIMKLKVNVMAWLRQWEHEWYSILLELLVLFFFSFILPWYYPVIAGKGIRQLGVFTLSFMVVLVLMFLIINRIKDLEHSRRELSIKIEQQEGYAKQVESQFEKVVALKHYYNKLYHTLEPFIRKKDMNGLQFYFEKYIVPIHHEHIESSNQLSNVKNDLLRNFLSVVIDEALSSKHIALDVDISGEVTLPDDLVLSMFEVLSIFTENAIRELQSQHDGLLHISLSQSNDTIAIQIANTLSIELDIENIYGQNQTCHGFGYGLKRVRTIVLEHPDIEHFTYKGGIYQGKEILVQQIKLTLGRG